MPLGQIFAGTWQGPTPPLLIDLELCRDMGWSWAELEATPLYVRNAAWDLLIARRKAEAG